MLPRPQRAAERGHAPPERPGSLHPNPSVFSETTEPGFRAKFWQLGALPRLKVGGVGWSPCPTLSTLHI